MYTIKEVLVFRNKNGIMWVYGMVIQGPKGGIYLLDAFCTEQWLKHTLKEKYWNTSIHEYFHTAVNKQIGTCIVDLDGKNDFITPKEYKGKTEFRRLDGLNKIRKLGLFDKIAAL